jgi:hypothetical protein
MTNWQEARIFCNGCGEWRTSLWHEVCRLGSEGSLLYFDIDNRKVRCNKCNETWPLKTFWIHCMCGHIQYAQARGGSPGQGGNRILRYFGRKREESRQATLRNRLRRQEWQREAAQQTAVERAQATYHACYALSKLPPPRAARSWGQLVDQLSGTYDRDRQRRRTESTVIHVTAGRTTLCGRDVSRRIDIFEPREASCRECKRRWQIATGL